MGRAKLTQLTVETNEVTFSALEMGSGPLALCLHGFPDTAHTWRHLLPALADAGFRAVAPFMRGYAPTEVPTDGCFDIGALAADAIALHDALGADERAVLIGHDWGAEATYAAAAFAPERWRRLVALSVPPRACEGALFGDYEQLKLFFYIFAFQTPLAEHIVSANGMAFLDRLWADWSPGYDASEDLLRVKDCLREPANLAAALAYYTADSQSHAPEYSRRYAGERAAAWRLAPQPTLYLHGERDGCIRVELVRGVARYLAPGSRVSVLEHCGHFLQLQRPADVNGEILAWVTS